MTELERLQNELLSVQSAITKSYDALEYEISSAGGSNGRRVRRQNIESLIRREKDLQRQISRLDSTQNGGSGAAYYGIVFP